VLSLDGKVESFLLAEVAAIPEPVEEIEAELADTSREPSGRCGLRLDGTRP
jgi:hypothetical protein